MCNVQLLFFKRDKEFVNGRDTETGNTALHIASRQGHLVSVTHYTLLSRKYFTTHNCRHTWVSILSCNVYYYWLCNIMTT